MKLVADSPDATDALRGCEVRSAAEQADAADEVGDGQAARPSQLIRVLGGG